MLSQLDFGTDKIIKSRVIDYNINNIKEKCEEPSEEPIEEMNEDELQATIEQSLAVLEKTVEQANMEKEALLVSLYVGMGCHCGVCTPALNSVRGT